MNQLGKAFGSTGCPCNIINPCRASCSCAHPFQSGGCGRCTRYGSTQQQVISAMLLGAREIDAELGAYVRSLINGGTSPFGKFSVSAVQQLVDLANQQIKDIRVCRMPRVKKW